MSADGLDAPGTHLDICPACKQSFGFSDPARTPAVAVDPITMKPPTAEQAPGAIRRPMCPPCFGDALQVLISRGLPLPATPLGGWPPEYADIYAAAAEQAAPPPPPTEESP